MQVAVVQLYCGPVSNLCVLCFFH